MTEEQLKTRFATNLICCRKKAGMTQLELAEKINYSDKSVSKWERGEGLPDLYVAVRIAELFGVTVDELLGEALPRRRLVRTHNRRLITLMALGLPWLVCTVFFFFFQVFYPSFPAWTFFVDTIVVDAIVAIVFTKLWWRRIWVFFSASLLIWAVPTCVVVLVHFPRIALIYAVAAVLQSLAVLWFLQKKK
ncbi:MAG: helix-turn-helix transcriptional regulator [Clostridia bacterium]|nr:helix-turn-helix transcriptional regulator [Clostridia bacterium]